jgi:hypothetical protein
MSSVSALAFRTRRAGGKQTHWASNLVKSMEPQLLRLARCSFLVFILLLGMARSTLAANTFASATSFALAKRTPGPTPPVTFSQSEFDDDVSAAFADAAAVAIDVIAASSRGNASATYGDIGLNAFTDVHGGSDMLQSGGEARMTVDAGWEDRIVLTVPFLPRGDTIKIRGKLNAIGDFFDEKATGPIHLPGFTTAGLIEGLLTASIFNSTGSVNKGPGCVCATRILAPISNPPTDIDIDDISNSFVEWGMPNDIGSTLTVTAKLFVRAAAGASAEAEISGFFGGSIHWGGIESVTNAATGELLTGWTITSDSGFDYSKPFEVPEPSSVLLFATAALVVPLTLWRRRASSAGY